MSKKYNCILCNYSTDIHCDYNRHVVTKKHILKTMQNEVSINDTKTHKKVTCPYCNKPICEKKFLKRH